MKRKISYLDAMDADNKALAAAGMPYRYAPDGIAHCAICHQKYFRADRVGYTNEPDCEHYDEFFEPKQS